MNYNPEIDYFEIMLSFACENKKHDIAVWGAHCTEYSQQIYLVDKSSSGYFERNPGSRNIFWFNWYCTDYADAERKKQQYRLVSDSMSQLYKVNESYLFITLNFDDTTTINGNKMLDIASRVVKLGFFVSGMYVLEKFREKEGIHHHVHFLVITKKRLKLSDVSKAIYKPKYVKDYVKGINFVDIKSPFGKGDKKARSYEDCEKYVSGDKRMEKLAYVAKDIIWREQLGLEHLYKF